MWKKDADLVVEPDVNGFKYDDFAHCTDLNLRAGEAATRAALRSGNRKWLASPEPTRKLLPASVPNPVQSPPQNNPMRICAACGLKSP